jgi:NAD(P)-dependent dehydrogenase (short-subunit alcohol dehydrogenase family)
LADIASPQLTPLSLDVNNAESRARAVAAVIEQAGHLDVLVNNAGVSLIAPIVEAPFDRVQNLIDTNLTSTIAMIQLVFPHMAERGGRIVNLGSAIGVMPSPFSGVYCATKAAVHMLSDVLRLELAPFGIDVVTVQPAAVRSEIEDRSAEGLEAFAADGSRYKRFFHALQMRLERPKQNPVSAEAYARDLADAVLAQHAPRTVFGGRGSTTYQVAGRLPGAVRDFFLRREFGLPSKPTSVRS